MIDLIEIDDAASVIAAFARLKDDPAFSLDLNVCVECGYLRRAPTQEQVRALTSAYVLRAAPNLKGRFAIVASWSWLYDSARHFATAASRLNTRVRVFQSSGEALAWLNPETVQPMVLRQTIWMSTTPAFNKVVRRSGLPRP